MNRKLRIGLIGAAGLLAVVAALPFVIPTGVYKEQIERSVSRATGRKFAILGPVRFSLFPTLGLTAERISLSNPPGSRRSAMATAEELRVGVRLLPLLLGRIEVSEIVIDRPDIDLEVDAAGRANWTFARNGAAPGPAGKPRMDVTAHFSGLRIAQGRVRYTNARNSSSGAIDKLDAAVDVTELDRPVNAAGAFAYAGRRVEFAIKARAARPLFEDRAAAFDLSLKAELLRASFAGTSAPNGTLAGHVTLAAPDLRGAAQWLGAKLPAGGGLKRFTLAGRIENHDRVTSLSGLTIGLDGAAIGGTVRLDTNGDVPRVTGALSIDRLDLNPYIAAAPKTGTPPAPPKPAAEEWSSDPIALGALGEFDAELALDAGRLSVKALKLGRTHIAVSLARGNLHAALGPMALYGGSGKAELFVDASGAVPVFRNAAEFDDVALQPFFSDTIGVGQIEGTGTIKFEVNASGSNAGAIMHTLGGSGSIAFRDGRLKGVDLGAVARSIQFVVGGATGQGAFTDYSRMSGSFALTGGVLSSKDFQLVGPLVQTTGSGSVDIGNRSIDFKIVPKAVASIAKLKLSIGVPFHIKGPWRHVHYTPDLVGTVGTILENLDLFGHAKPDPKKKRKSPTDALKNMLGIH